MIEPAQGSGIHNRQSTERRKILFLTYRFPYPISGGDRLKSYNLLRHLSTIADVDLIALDEWNTATPESCDHLRSFVHSVTVVPFGKISAGSRIVRSLFSSMPIEIAYYDSSLMHHAVDAALRSKKYDLAIGFFMRTARYLEQTSGIATMLIAEDSRLLADERATKEFSFTPEYMVRRIDAHRLQRFEPQTIKKFSVTTFVATPDEERVKAIDPALRTAILTNGVDPNYFEYYDGARENALLFSGHLGIYHNRLMAEHIVRRIYPAIKEHSPQMKLWIAGKDPGKKLQTLIASTEGAELFADVEDMRPFYQKAILFLHPQTVGAGIQNKLLEAMSMGCPIITTPIGASGIDGIINGMHVMVSETDEDFVSVGLRLLSDEKERGWLARNSRMLIERRYSWDHIFSSFDDIIEGIVPDFFNVTRRQTQAVS